MSAALTDRGIAKTTVNVTPSQMAQARAIEADQLAGLPDDLASVISKVLEVVARGGTVTIGAVPQELTTTAAASMLNISRPTLMKLIRAGEIPSHKVGSHARVMTEDVIEYRERVRNAQRAAFDDLRAFEDEHGLVY